MVVQVHVVIIDSRLHDEVGFAGIGGCGDGGEVCWHVDAVHHIDHAVVCQQAGVELADCFVHVVEEWLHSFVGQLAPLAGHRACERAHHVVVDEDACHCAHGDAVNLSVEFIVVCGCSVWNLVRCPGICVVGEDESLPGTLCEVMPQRFVGGYEHGCHVFLGCHLVVVAGPSRVEPKAGSVIVAVHILIGIVPLVGSQRSGLEEHGPAVGIMPYISTLCGIVVIREVPLSKDGVGELGIHFLVTFSQDGAVERCAEEVEDVAEDVRLAIGADDVGHALQRYER